jgi:hypothetical protein
VFISTDELASYLGVDLDLEDEKFSSTLTSHILSAQSFVENYIGYPIEIGDHECYLDGDGTEVAWLPRFPVTLIKEAQWYDPYTPSWNDFIPGQIKINAKTGELYIGYPVINYIGTLTVLNKFPTGFQNIRVLYEHGYDPEDVSPEVNTLKFILCEVAGLINSNPGSLSYQSVDDGISRARFGYENTTFVSMLSPEVVIALSSFAKRGCAR